jgi:polysaccharide deacetylase family protein (PEP-CTERM system associated)
MLNALTFDIDDLAYGLHMKNGSRRPSDYLVERETYSLLEFLEGLKIKATMFIPGYVAEMFPALVRDIAATGHEIGGHGYRHIDAFRLGREGFRKDIRAGRKILEDIASTKVSAYKDPCWGITSETPWAYDELIEAGYDMDNTAGPSLLPSLGQSPHELTPFMYKGALTVVPVTSLKLFGKSMPFNGGLFSAYVPPPIQTGYYKKLNQKGMPFNYYCHPYEVCPADVNRRIWKRRSLRAKFYGLYFGIYRYYIRNLARHFKLATLRETYGKGVL